MSLSPFRTVFRRQFQNLLRQRPQHRAQSASSTSPTSTSTSTSASPKSTQNAAQSTAAATGTQTSFWKRLGPITKAGEAYGRSQRKRPYLTQVVSALIIYGAADVSAQSMDNKDYDSMRTGRSFLIGALAAIPSFRWFIWLSTNFNYSSRILSMGTKVVVNQIAFAPLFNTYFFSAHALLSGQGIEAAVQRVKDTLVTSWINSCKLWPAVTVVSFTFVPMEYRSVFTGLIAIGWQTYLSYLNSRVEIKEAKTESVRAELVASVQAASGTMAMAS
ncbi:Protein SYM1 [Cladobotryum mycophilum]|uniref:Protein SYM1 n=1 Tax=Cladobotryum mycophilum TaxID=491253 RepID=A0ABR0SUL8_9HYPO